MFSVDVKKCIGCGQCIKDCFVKDIDLINGKALIKNKACFKCGHCIAVCPVAAVSTDEYSMDDVVEYNKENFFIEPNNLLNFIKFERTIRQFNERAVENEKILKIIEAGRFTQTASNAQNVNYIVVKDQLQEVRKITLEVLNNLGKHILENSTNILYKRYARMWIKMYDEFITNPLGVDNLFFKASTLIIVTSENSLNAGLASANMKLMVDALGLGAVFSGFFTKACEGNSKIKDFLEIEENQNVVTCLVIGYPNVKYLRTVPRKEANIIWK